MTVSTPFLVTVLPARTVKIVVPPVTKVDRNGERVLVRRGGGAVAPEESEYVSVSGSGSSGSSLAGSYSGNAGGTETLAKVVDGVYATGTLLFQLVDDDIGSG